MVKIHCAFAKSLSRLIDELEQPSVIILALPIGYSILFFLKRLNVSIDTHTSPIGDSLGGWGFLL